MSSLNRFLKINKTERSNAKYAVSEAFKDEDGNILEWEIRPLTTKQNDELKDQCITQVPVPGKSGMFRSHLNLTKYIAKMIAISVVEPNLNSAELQDSYSVKTPEDLIREMVDNPVEYDRLGEFIQEYNGFDQTLSDKVEEAKN